MKLCKISLLGKRFPFVACPSSKMSSLETLRFDNLVLRKLPIDTEERNYVRIVNAACFSKVKPTPVDNPTLVAYSGRALSLLGLSTDQVDRPEFVEYFSGNKLLPGSEPAAHCYCGHQFGYFSGQLGDGAAIYLGEVINSVGERWEIQLKGAGLTPYSRTADGRKVLRSTIREFLCSEAMHFLGIPTSRAGTCITSDSKVIRDIFYDRHPIEEKCSIVLRIAPTFIRFGSFEIFKTLDATTGKVGPSVGRIEILNTMLNYVIETFFKEIHQSNMHRIEKYTAFFKEVVLRTARMVALWQCVGFCHGVLNTDNMSILGLTLDYGPFGFLDMYDPQHVCNASDDGGRYTFVKQPEICRWNLRKFAEAIEQALPLCLTLPLLEMYDTEFQSTYLNKMRAKLGLISTKFPEDKVLIEKLFNTMGETGADFTNTFLCFLNTNVTDDISTIETSFGVTKEKILENCYPVEVLMKAYQPALNSPQLRAFMLLAETAPGVLEQLGGASIAVERMMTQLRKGQALEGLTEKSKMERDTQLWNQWLNRYKVRLQKDLEAYEGDVNTYNDERLSTMKKNNPRFILRNYIAQNAIEKAEKGDFTEVRKLVELLENPFDHSYTERMSHSVNMNTESEDAHSSTPAASSSKYQPSYDRPPNAAFSIRVT